MLELCTRQYFHKKYKSRIKVHINDNQQNLTLQNVDLVMQTTVLIKA